MSQAERTQSNEPGHRYQITWVIKCNCDKEEQAVNLYNAVKKVVSQHGGHIVNQEEPKHDEKKQRDEIRKDQKRHDD